MGYFSNGTEGMDYEEKYCARCVHDANHDCPVLLIHSLFNYDQLRPGNEKLREAMSALIPRRPDTFNDQCRMFIENPKPKP